jgi:hypothetical protein
MMKRFNLPAPAFFFIVGTRGKLIEKNGREKRPLVG